MKSKMRQQKNINSYESLRTLLIQVEDPGVAVGTDLRKVAKRNWMKSINLIFCVSLSP